MRTPPAGPYDVVLNLFSSIGYFGDAEEDLAAMRAWHDVLVPGGLLVIETNHRDRVARHLPADEQLPLGESEAVELPRVDWVAGIVHSTVVLPDGRRRHFDVRLYTATELVGLATRAGFTDVDVTGDWQGTPLSPETRLVLRARRPSSS